MDINRNNPTKKMHAESAKCPYCGAPLLSEVCQYCGNYVGEVATADLSAEYPVLECKPAQITFWNLFFPAVFAFAFGFFGFVMPVIMGDMGENIPWLLCLPFAAIGMGAMVIVLYTIAKALLVTLKGENIVGTVYGYMDDTVAYNGVNGQVAKILISTTNGKRFVFYPLGSTKMLYPINSKVTLRVYKNLFRIVPESYA